MKTQIVNLKKIDLGRYLIGENINQETGRGLIFNPEKYGKKNFDIMLLTFKNHSNAVRMIKEIIDLIKKGY